MLSTENRSRLDLFLHHGVSFYWDIISKSLANETLVNTLLFAFFYIYMRDIGVVIAVFSLSCFALECGWDMGVRVCLFLRFPPASILILFRGINDLPRGPR